VDKQIDIEMRGLSLWQPWASLWACGAKEFETRSRPISYRGPIAIHAAAKSMKSILKDCFPLGEWDYSPDYEAKKTFLNAVGFALLKPLSELPFGAIIATADLIGCYRMVRHGGRGISSEGPGWIETDNGVYEPTDQELMFGNWTPGRYAWEIANVKMLAEPIPYKGMQGLWRMPNPELVLKGA
jgi:hypothetical protein